MGRKKNISGSGKKLSNQDEEMFLSNLNLGRQPKVRLTKLNIPESFKNNGMNNFSINVKSKSFKQLFPKLNINDSESKKITSRTLKPRRKTRNIVRNLTFTENQPDSFQTNEENHSVDKENHCSDSEEFVVEGDHIEDNPAEKITRTDKVIDTFLNVLRKTTDDNTILTALQRDYICDRCQRGFLKKHSLRKHMMICCFGKKQTRKKKIESHSCPVCGITYLKKESLDKHNASVHNLKKMYKCLVCNQHFYNEQSLTLHCRSQHGLGGTDIYKCPYCEATFNLRNDLNCHCRKAHNTTKYYICPKCLECFKNEDTCKLHEQSHGYCCDICMYKTNTENELVTHRLTHLYKVVYKCSVCSRTFKAKRDFSRHIKVHER